jgi:sugar phosphate permease
MLSKDASHETGLMPLLNQETYDDSKSYQVYTYRWVVLALFVFSGVANAMVYLTWAPITDKAQTYWNDINITAVNLLSVIFQICYVPGTFLALRFAERHSLRGLLLRGGFLTSIGCVFRVFGTLLIDSSSGGSYALVLFGTFFVGLSQPFYLNMPAKIASTWFGVSERNAATTLASLANPLGSAIGSLLPAMFVNSESDHAIQTGVRTLLLVQMIVALVALGLSFFFLKSQPETPASASSAKMLELKSSKGLNTIREDMGHLFQNAEYRKLLVSFSIVLGNLNAITALLNQLPGNYSNGDIGLTGAALIMSGFLGAFSTGFVLDCSKSLKKVLKTAYFLTTLSWIFFLSNCRNNNFPLFITSAALLGLATLPTSEFLFPLYFLASLFIFV